MKLTEQQKRHLRGLAHSLKPVVMVGQHGLKPTIFEELEIALDAHELIKVRIAADRDERKEISEQIIKKTRAVLIQSIGQINIIYRRNNKDPKIPLPSK